MRRKDDPWCGGSARRRQVNKVKTMRASVITKLLGRTPKYVAAFAALACFTTGLHAQISVTASGAGPITFAAEPALPITEWATINITTGSATSYINPDQVDAGVQTIDATTITRELNRSNVV